MTTLAGAKMKRFRAAQRPKKLTRAEFGERYGVPGATVLGYEEYGKRPQTAELVNRLAEDGICDHADWYQPADAAPETDGRAAA